MMAQRRKSIYFSKRASKTKYLFPKFKNLNAKMCWNFKSSFKKNEVVDKVVSHLGTKALTDLVFPQASQSSFRKDA